jgi:polar amino acid transport system substrate-binding protein
VIRTEGEPAGAEVELVRRLAAELGATPEWVWGGEQNHLEALERFELDLVVGGLTKDTPWRNRVGLAGPYFEDRVLVGAPGPNPPGDLSGLKVRVKSGDVAASYLKKKGAVPVPVPDLATGDGPAAAADWRLEQLGLKPAGDELQSREHVMAVPPGENAWIAHLEEFFDRQRGNIKGLLQQEAAKR